LTREGEPHLSDIDESNGPLGQIAVVLDIRHCKLVKLNNTLRLDARADNRDGSAKVGPNGNDALWV
jgi:hypothetical protein